MPPVTDLRLLARALLRKGRAFQQVIGTPAGFAGASPDSAPSRLDLISLGGAGQFPANAAAGVFKTNVQVELLIVPHPAPIASGKLSLSPG